VSLLDLLRQEYIKGRVLDKYMLNDGSIALVIDQEGTHKRYHVSFRDNYNGPGLDNLYGLLKEPFGGKTDCLVHLINKDDTIELTMSYSKGPFRQAYQIHSVSGPASHREPGKLVGLPYRPARMSRY
jgi:hypothetical protein